MKPARILLVGLALLVALPAVRAQNTSEGQKEAPPEVPLRIQVVISEFDGSKKISSLPYALYTVTAGPGGPGRGTRESMRYGVRVPISTGSFQAGVGTKGTPLVNTQFQYQQVGTNIDYGAYAGDGGNYQLVFMIDRSWLGTENEAAVKSGGLAPGQPILPTFRDQFTVMMRNGETKEGASAVDPITGHVLKVDVTLTVLK